MLRCASPLELPLAAARVRAARGALLRSAGERRPGHLGWFVFVAVAATALGGCRSPATVAPNGRPGVARPDAQGDAAASVVARRHASDDLLGALDVPGDPAIEYRGEKIPLKKRYSDFDEYRNDPDKFVPEVLDRVRKLVETAPIPERCADRDEVFQVLSGLDFPGYGSNGVGEPHATDPLRVIGGAVEIPGTDTSRVVVYVRDDRGYRLADDTVLPGLVTDAIVRDGKVTYRSLEGKAIAERPIRSPGH